MYQWWEFKSRQGKNKNLTAQKSNSNTVWFNFQTYIYIYVCGFFFRGGDEEMEEHDAFRKWFRYVGELRSLHTKATMLPVQTQSGNK